MFADNVGLATLRDPMDGTALHATVEVQLTTSDEALAGESQIGLLKLDVERHELAALRGAQCLFAEGRTRDIVCEDHRPYLTPSSKVLEAEGYAVATLRMGKRPELRDPRDDDTRYEGRTTRRRAARSASAHA